jgi:hypothetical protein
MNNLQKGCVTCYRDGIQLLRSFGEGQPSFVPATSLKTTR